MVGRVRERFFLRSLIKLPIYRIRFQKMDSRPIVSASLVSRNPDEILCKTVNHTRVITLNKPSSLNAFNHNMAIQMHEELQRAASDDQIRCILIKGGKKSFCAGGDVRELAETSSRCESTPNSGTKFLIDEYSVMLSLKQSVKPVIALAHGYTMGAGCGIAVNSQYTVATEDTVMSMPETAIGYYPDNGGSYFLSRLGSHLGMYLGLTCSQLRGEEAYLNSLATHYVTYKDGSLEEMEKQLLNEEDPSQARLEGILKSYHVKCSTKAESGLAPYKAAINSVFRQETMEDIIKALREDNSAWSLKTLQQLSSKSPYALKLTMRMLKKSENLTFAECLSMELKLGQHLLSNPRNDFFSGVQAVLVDKTKPTWNPRTLEEIDNRLLDKNFEDIINYPGLDIKAKL